MSPDTRRWCFADQLGPVLSALRYRAAELGDQAMYWWFLDRNKHRLTGNRRMNQPLAGLRRLTDLDAVVKQQRRLAGSVP